MRTSTVFCVLLLAAGCEQAKSKLDAVAAQSGPLKADIPCGQPAPATATTTMAGNGSNAKPKPVEAGRKTSTATTSSIARRRSPRSSVKHILLAWKELDAATYHGRIDKGAKDRTNAEAAKLALGFADQLRADPSKIDELVKANSEDPGAQGGDAYDVKADTAFVPEFKKLALRLKPNEVGIVKTAFGYHVIMRVPPPPPDPLESADILARPAEAGPVSVQHVLIGWKDVAAKRNQDPRARRTARRSRPMRSRRASSEKLASAAAPTSPR